MQKVWTQAARPRLSCHNLSGYDTVSNVLARRTTSAPARRRLTFKDAFTILLAPVLATAFVADTSWKDKQRKDWDDKIAEVVAELEQLRARERQAWSALQQRSIRIGAVQQRRFYATAAHAVQEAAEDQEFLQVPEWQWTDDLEEITRSQLDSEHESTKALRQIQRLIAVKLALKMILHVHMGKGPRFVGTDLKYDSGSLPTNINAISDQLQRVKKTLVGLKKSGPDWNKFTAPSEDQLQLNRQLIEISETFNRGSITISNFVGNLARAILQSKDSPTSTGYVAVMKALCRAGYYDMSYRVIHALDEGQVHLDSHAIFHVLLLYGKTRDTAHFDKFLKSLTRLSRDLQPGSRWEWWRLDGIQLPVPVRRDSALLQMLIYTSLKLDQPHRAEAWASLLREKDDGPKYKTYILNNFLKHYSAKTDWRRGKVWLHIARTWFTSLAADSARSLQRVVLSMLDLCVACGQRKIYAEILENAAKSQIGVYTVDPTYVKEFTPRSNAILREWELLHNRSVSPEAQLDPYDVRVRQFQSLLEDSLDRFSQAVLPAGATWFNNAGSPSPMNLNKEKNSNDTAYLAEIRSEWEELHQAQQKELRKLRGELAQTRSLYASLPTSTERIAATQTQMERELASLRSQLCEMRSHSLTPPGARRATEQPELRAELEQLRAELDHSRNQYRSLLAAKDQEGINGQRSTERDLEQPPSELNISKSWNPVPPIQKEPSTSKERADVTEELTPIHEASLASDSDSQWPPRVSEMAEHIKTSTSRPSPTLKPHTISSPTAARFLRLNTVGNRVVSDAGQTSASKSKPTPAPAATHEHAPNASATSSKPPSHNLPLSDVPWPYLAKRRWNAERFNANFDGPRVRFTRVA